MNYMKFRQIVYSKLDTDLIRTNSLTCYTKNHFEFQTWYFSYDCTYEAVETIISVLSVFQSEWVIEFFIVWPNSKNFSIKFELKAKPND